MPQVRACARAALTASSTLASKLGIPQLFSELTAPAAAGGVMGTGAGAAWFVAGNESAGVTTGGEGTIGAAVALGTATAALVPTGGAMSALLDVDVGAAVVSGASSLPPPPHAITRAAAAALEKMIRFMNGSTRLTRPFVESDSGRNCAMKRACRESICALHVDLSAPGVSSAFCHQYVDRRPSQASPAAEVDGAVAFGVACQFAAIPL